MVDSKGTKPGIVEHGLQSFLRRDDLMNIKDNLMTMKGSLVTVMYHLEGQSHIGRNKRCIY